MREQPHDAGRPAQRGAADALGYRKHPRTRELTNAGNRMREGAGEARLGPGRVAGSVADEAELTGAERWPEDGVSGRATDPGPPERTTAPVPASASGQEVTAGAIDWVFRSAEEVLYHGSRRDFLSSAHRWMMFATILFGASAAASTYPLVSGLLASGTGAADIAFDFTGRAQSHADMRRRYLDLAARCSARPAEADTLFEAERMAMSADEPPLFRWAALIARRNACIALGREVDNLLPWKQRMLAHVCRG